MFKGADYGLFHCFFNVFLNFVLVGWTGSALGDFLKGSIQLQRGEAVCDAHAEFLILIEVFAATSEI